MSAKVILLEDSEDLREVMKDLVQLKFDLECRCFGSYDDFVADGDEVLNAKIIFLDVSLGFGKPGGVDAYQWLRAHDFGGRVYFFTGHERYHPAIGKELIKEVQVLEKPMQPAELDAIMRATFM